MQVEDNGRKQIKTMKNVVLKKTKTGPHFLLQHLSSTRVSRLLKFTKKVQRGPRRHCKMEREERRVQGTKDVKVVIAGSWSAEDVGRCVFSFVAFCFSFKRSPRPQSST